MASLVKIMTTCAGLVVGVIKKLTIDLMIETQVISKGQSWSMASIGDIDVEFSEHSEYHKRCGTVCGLAKVYWRWNSNQTGITRYNCLYKVNWEEMYNQLLSRIESVERIRVETLSLCGAFNVYVRTHYVVIHTSEKSIHGEMEALRRIEYSQVIKHTCLIHLPW